MLKRSKFNFDEIDSIRVLKKRYRVLLKQCHPDVCGQAVSSSLISELVAEYKQRLKHLEWEARNKIEVNFTTQNLNGEVDVTFFKPK